MPVTSFRDLEVWKDSMQLITECYAMTASFPDGERYGLVSQIRRAAISIPANLAEGHVRPTAAYRNHVNIALASQAELDTTLEVALRLSS